MRCAARQDVTSTCKLPVHGLSSYCTRHPHPCDPHIPHSVDLDFVVALYKRDGVDTKTLPTIQVGLPADASAEDKQHYVGFAKFLGQGVQGTSLPKYAEIRLPQSRNLCVWLCPPAHPASFDATCKLELLVPPVLMSSYSFSPTRSPAPSPTSKPKAAAVEEDAPKPSAPVLGLGMALAAAAAARAQTPPVPSYPLPSPRPLPTLGFPPKAAAASSPSSFMEVDKSFLSTLSQNHTWCFGALAELLHNACDAGSTALHVDVRTEDKGQMVLELKDNGEGMSHHEMEAMFRLGKSYSAKARDVHRTGRYGLGFKQGSLRIGSTAVVLSKSLKHKTLSFGILSNEPHLRNEEAAPICRVVTLSADTMEPDPAFTPREAFREVSELIAEHSFITPERWWPLMLNTWDAGESGTTVFIQGIERKDPDTGKLWRELRVDKANADLLLVNRAGKKHLNTRGGSLADSVPIDHSLRAYLKVAFLYHKMELFLLGQKVGTPNLMDTLTDVKRFNLLKDEMHTKKPVLAIVGRSAEDARLGLGGAHFYCTNVLVASYVRQEIGITDPREGMGVLAVVHLDPRQYETQHTKQIFRRPNPALEKIEERLGRVWAQYVTQGMTQLVVKGKAVDILAHQMVTLTDFLQCESCSKWRIVSPEYAAKFTGTDDKWYCWTEGSPVESCETPEAALVNDEKEVLVDFKAGSQGADFLVPVGGGGGGGMAAASGQHQEKEQVPPAMQVVEKKKAKKNKKHRHQEEEGGHHAKKRRRKEAEDDHAQKPRFLVSRADCTLLKILARPHLSLASVPGGAKVAFKSIALRQDAESRNAFKEELKKLRRLSHENLVPVVAARMEETGPPAVGFAYQEGLVDLHGVLLKPPTIVSLEDRLLVACKVAAALDFLHHHGFVHGAVRPSNVLVSFPTPKLRVVKLTDFGIAHRTALGGPTAEAIAFSAPEALVSVGVVGEFRPPRDMWSMGILLVELMSGRKAWGLSNSTQELRRLVDEFSLSSFPGLRNLHSLLVGQSAGSEWHEILDEVGGLVEACLRKKPSERLASQELVSKLVTQSAPFLYRAGVGGQR